MRVRRARGVEPPRDVERVEVDGQGQERPRIVAVMAIERGPQWVEPVGAVDEPFGGQGRGRIRQRRSVAAQTSAGARW
jgi:hypothetical protein